MRYWIGFVLFALVLGTLRLVGCGDEGPLEYEYPNCRDYHDCADGTTDSNGIWHANDCTEDKCVFSEGGSTLGTCEHENVVDGDALAYCSTLDISSGACLDGVCQPNPCPHDVCATWMPRVSDGACALVTTSYDGRRCLIGGTVFGVCIAGSCVDYPCGGVVCDDGDPCTVGTCTYPDGECEFKEKQDWNRCFDGDFTGVCVGGDCIEDPCEGVVCDDGDLCTLDTCTYPGGECEFYEKCPTTTINCRIRSCDATDGLCNKYDPAPNGTGCSPGHWCLFGLPYCQGGDCVCPPPVITW